MSRIRRFMLIGILFASVAPLQACVVVVPGHWAPRPPGPFLMHEDHPDDDATIDPVGRPLSTING